MSINRPKYYDNHTLYVTSGVAKEEQLYKALKDTVKERENKINEEGKIKNENWEPFSFQCDIKVNLIVNKNKEYYGFGYVRVSSEKVYWMLLGKNPDGTERIIEYPDPNWNPPVLKENLEEKIEEMSWFEIAQEEDKHIQPIIRENLEPLMIIPGYKYDEMQYKHLQDMAILDGKDPNKVPNTGYFEFARAYVRDVEPGKLSNVLCARQIPEWIPNKAFKNIFRYYVTDSNKRVLTDTGEYDNYPLVTIIDGKKEDRIVFITFDPSTKDAMFSLLMTRKVRIKHPEKPELKCVIIFDHAYEHGKDPKIINKNSKYKSRYDSKYDKVTKNKNYEHKKINKERDDVDIGKFNYTK